MPFDDSSPMPFGKHAGTPLGELPEEYIEWLATIELREPLRTWVLNRTGGSPPLPEQRTAAKVVTRPDGPLRLLVVDLETTGTDCLRHSVLEFGAVALPSMAEFFVECRIWEGAEITDGALRVNGCSRDRCTDPLFPPEGTALREFLDWQRSTCPNHLMIGGLNPRFDRDFLAAADARAGGKKLPFHFRTVDLHTLAVSYACLHEPFFPVPATGFTTDEIYALLGLPPEPKPHSALVGAQCEARALALLLGIGSLQD